MYTTLTYELYYNFAKNYFAEMATASEQRSLQLEIDMMKELGCHRHLITMLACCSKGNHLALVMEYVSGGNLHDFLRNHRQNVQWNSIYMSKLQFSVLSKA